QAVAEIAGGGYVCMVGLDPNAPSTLDMSDKARVTAEKCAIYSNSKNKASLRLHSLARVKAELVCVAGGISGPESAVTPNKPVTDCPVLPDPLRDRPEPNVGLLECNNILGKNSITGTDLLGKDGILGGDPLGAVGDLVGGVLGGGKGGGGLNLNDLVDDILEGDIVGSLAPGLLVTGTQELDPGVYCGGINVIGGHVKLNPGTYILNNGGLVVANGGSIEVKGNGGVGFYLTG